MSETACRQCGKTSSLADFPSGEFICPECGWRELMPNAVAQRTRSRQGRREEGGGTATIERTETEVNDHQPEMTMETATITDATPPASFEAVDRDHLGSMNREDFTIWCARLLTRFGYTVNHDDGDDGGECDLRISREGETIFVDCLSMAPNELVDRAACQRLVGALVGAGSRRGLVMTPGACGDACRVFIERLAGDYCIDFIGGERLEETVQEMMTGPLAVWWR